MNFILGDSSTVPAEARIQNAVIFFSGIFTLYVFTGGQIAGQPPYIQIPIIGIALVFGLLFYVSRFRNHPFWVKPTFIVFGMLSIMLYYFQLNGIKGEIPMYFILGSMLSITIGNKKYYSFLVSAWVAAFLFCVYLEHLFPSIVSTDEANATRGTEHIIATIGITSFVAIMLSMYKNLYQKEKSLVESKNAELERINQELTLAREDALLAVKAKSEFLSTMSHEIRTPLNAVIGMSHILMQEEPRPDQLDNLRIIKFASENLMSLINDILDFNKIEVGKVIFEVAPFQLRELVESVKMAFNNKADENGISIYSYVDPQIPAILIGDKTRLTQVLNNLMSNAVKFTDKGTVNLFIHQTSSNDHKINLRFEVIDTGIGIPENMLDRVFEGFTQADASITRKYGGTGLGLAISKKLVELQGGNLTVESTVNVGTKFSFDLDFDRASSQQMPQTKSQIEMHQELSGKSILLAEDNQLNVVIAKKFLSNWGLNIDLASNGREAVEMVKENHYDCILMDLRMPEMDGIDAAKLIRALPEPNCYTPIIALTASAMLEEQNEIFQAGMNEYVSKPFNPDELRSKIEKAVFQQPLLH